jgi:hypothetical protein
VAELMQHDYDVTVRRGQLGDRTVDVLIGQRRSGRGDLPDSMQLWADRASRIIQRAELHWAHDNALILELLPGEPVPAGWYDYQAHCQGEPTVRHIPPER